MGQAITIDYVTLLYTGALVIVVGFLVGVVPALSATGSRMQDTLRADSRTATASRRAAGRPLSARRRAAGGERDPARGRACS